MNKRNKSKLHKWALLLHFQLPLDSVGLSPDSVVSSAGVEIPTEAFDDPAPNSKQPRKPLSFSFTTPLPPHTPRSSTSTPSSVGPQSFKSTLTLPTLDTVTYSLNDEVPITTLRKQNERSSPFYFVFNGPFYFSFKEPSDQHSFPLSLPAIIPIEKSHSPLTPTSSQPEPDPDVALPNTTSEVLPESPLLDVLLPNADFLQKRMDESLPPNINLSGKIDPVLDSKLDTDAALIPMKLASQESTDEDLRPDTMLKTETSGTSIDSKPTKFEQHLAEFLRYFFLECLELNAIVFVISVGLKQS